MEQTEQTREGQFLVFGLAGRTCALPVRDIQEVVPMALLSSPPGLPRVMDGFLNLRGVLVPVVRLERLFDLPPGKLTLQTTVLIMRGGQTGGNSEPATLLGLSVDHVREVIPAELSESKAVAPGSVLNDCVIGQVGFGDSAIHVLSAERLLLEQERRTIARLQAETQTRLNGLDGHCP